MDIIEDKHPQSNDTSIDNSDDGIFYEDYRINETLSGDEIEAAEQEEEEQDDYNLEHEDL